MGQFPKRTGQANKCVQKCSPGSCFHHSDQEWGAGSQFQDATRVYITAPAWNPATELQAIGRSHRTGQTQAVYVKKLVYKECVHDL
jgi:SNF2 family DNA or RNA helicase